MASTSFLTIDTLANVFYTTVLSPYFASIIPLTLLARNVSPSSPILAYSLAWLLLTVALRVFYVIDSRLEGGKPREVDWSDEVVLITGGAGGLGGLIAEILGMRGVSVAVVDILGGDHGQEAKTTGQIKAKSSKSLKQIEEEWEAKNCAYFKCDVSHRSEVKTLKKRVELALGKPTIIINNAAVVHGKPLLDLNEEELMRSHNVNVISHYNTIQEFLPDILSRGKGGTIVTISSVLGYLGCAALSDYTGTKAAVTALHHSLTAELSIMAKGSSNHSYPQSVKTVLVTPGQLSTPLFHSISSPSTFFGPVVDVTYLAKQIVKKIDEGTSGELSTPLYARWISVLNTLPRGLKGVVRHLANLDMAALVERLARSNEL